MRLKARVREFAGGIALALLLAPIPAAATAPTLDAAASAPVQRAAAAPRPAIWLLEDEDTRIYLFGTTHLFARGFQWRSPRLEAVIDEADELVMETADQGEMDDLAAIATLFMDKPEPILERVSPDRRERFRTMIEASGVPIEMWDSMHSWAAAFMLMASQGLGALDEAPAEGEPALSGAEEELTAAFREAGKPISAVETSEQQIAMFRTLAPSAQRALLESVIDDADAVAEAGSTGGGDLNWARGDVEAIAREMEALSPELYDALLTRRNRAWSEWLAARLERPGTVLFAVGAGHLAGRESVQSMLAARGLRTRRID